MKRCLAGLLMLALALPAFASCQAAAGPGLKVVTTTTLMSAIAEEIAGDRVKVTSIVPPSQHPGNFDVKPGDLRSLAEADILLVHGWPGEGFVPAMVSAANNQRLRQEKIVVAGNWMIPAAQAEAAEKVAAALGRADAGNAATYQERARSYRGEVMAAETRLRASLESARGHMVIASVRQADFLEWAGLKVVATYSDPETLTPQAVSKLVDQGRQASVRLVVDNLQSGPNAGKTLAEELGARRLVLSNFPGGFDNTDTWPKAIAANVRLITEAVR